MTAKRSEQRRSHASPTCANPYAIFALIAGVLFTLIGFALVIFIGVRSPTLSAHPWSAGVGVILVLTLPLPLILSPYAAHQVHVGDAKLEFTHRSKYGPITRTQDNAGFIRLRTHGPFTLAYRSGRAWLLLPSSLRGSNGEYRFELNGDKLQLARVPPRQPITDGPTTEA